MAVSFKGNGTAVSSDGTTSVTAAPYASAASGDLQFLYVIYKATTDLDAVDAAIPDIDGWRLLWADYGGVANTGDDTGFVVNIVYWRSQIEPISAEVVVPDFSCQAILAQQSSYTYDAEHVYMIPASVRDNTHGANYSVDTTSTVSSDQKSRWWPDNTSDFAIVVTALTSSAGAISGDNIDGDTAGWTTRNNETTSSGGNARLRVGSYTGTGFNTQPTYGHTNASSNSGVTIFIHIGEISGITQLWHEQVTQPDMSSDGSSIVYRPQTTANIIAFLTVMASSELAIAPGEFTVPAGWTLLGTKSATGGTVSTNADNGVKVSTYYRLSSPTEFSNTTVGTFGLVSTTISDADYGWTYLQVLATAGVWGFPSVASDSVVDSGPQTTTSVTAMGLTTGDSVLIYTVNGANYVGGSASISISGMSFSTLASSNNSNTWARDSENNTHVYGEYLFGLTGTETGVVSAEYAGVSNAPQVSLFIKLSVVSGGLSITAAAPTASFSTFDSRYIVSISGVDPAQFDIYNILRISADNNYEPEFLAADEAITTSGFTVYDYEFHFAPKGSLDEESHYYQLDLYKAGAKLGSIVSNTVTPHNDREIDPEYNGVASPSTWIKKLDGSTAASYPITVGDFATWTRGANILSENHILGNPFPFIITDVMGGKTGSFTIIVFDTPTWVGGGSTVATIEMVEDLLDSGEILYFSTTWPMLSGIHDFYFRVRTYTVKRMNRTVALHDPTGSQLPVFEVTVEFVEQERPADQGNIAPITWATVLANYSTWAGMSAANTSWLDVLQDG